MKNEFGKKVKANFVGCVCVASLWMFGIYNICTGLIKTLSPFMRLLDFAEAVLFIVLAILIGYLLHKDYLLTFSNFSIEFKKAKK